jgi:hypothetical protein
MTDVIIILWFLGLLKIFGVWFLAGARIFLFATASRQALVPTQPPIQWVPAANTPGIKRPGREADHSPSSSADVQSTWSYTSTPPYVFMEGYLVKHRDNFTFNLHCALVLTCSTELIAWDLLRA